jgi:beta-glucosidase
VLGIQEQGVMTSVKHYILNEQETHRNPYNEIASVSSNVDDKTMHELYLWPFADAVRAGATTVMCSYQRINNSYACQNSYTLNGLLKTELGFEGAVVADWGGQQSGVASAEAGMDVTMPNQGYWGENGDILVEAVTNGSMKRERLEDMATRIIAAWYQMGQDVSFWPLVYSLPQRISSDNPRVHRRRISHLHVSDFQRTFKHRPRKP